MRLHAAILPTTVTGRERHPRRRARLAARATTTLIANPTGNAKQIVKNKMGDSGCSTRANPRAPREMTASSSDEPIHPQITRLVPPESSLGRPGSPIAINFDYPVFDAKSTVGCASLVISQNRRKKAVRALESVIGALEWVIRSAE